MHNWSRVFFFFFFFYDKTNKSTVPLCAFPQVFYLYYVLRSMPLLLSSSSSSFRYYIFFCFNEKLATCTKWLFFLLLSRYTKCQRIRITMRVCMYVRVCECGLIVDRDIFIFLVFFTISVRLVLFILYITTVHLSFHIHVHILFYRLILSVFVCFCSPLC